MFELNFKDFMIRFLPDLTGFNIEQVITVFHRKSLWTRLGPGVAGPHSSASKTTYVPRALIWAVILLAKHWQQCIIWFCFFSLLFQNVSHPIFIWMLMKHRGSLNIINKLVTSSFTYLHGEFTEGKDLVIFQCLLKIHSVGNSLQSNKNYFHRL